ncbi:MAG: SpoIIE family protein phosphatase [Chloroflexales bacterium]|nr:SpoIIE family protein phosphatase [Chloroflexales bacterium]
MDREHPADLRAELDRTRGELEAIAAVGQAVRATRDIDALYPIIAAQLQRVLPLDALFISLFFADRAIVRFVYQLDQGVADTTPEDWPLARANLSRRVIEERGVVRIADLTLFRTKSNLTRFGSDRDTRAWMAAPMLAGDEVQGVISVQSYDVDIYDERHERLLLLIAGQIGVAVENARLVGQLRGTIAELASDLTHEHERQARLQYEFNMARRIQSEFLPTESPSIAGAVLYYHTQAATEVGGDFYQFVSLPDGGMAVAVGDVSGKGMPAALIMAAVCSLLPTLATLYRTPAAVLSALNGQLYARMRRNRMNVAICYMLVAPGAGAMLLANAGMPFPVRRRGGVWADVEAGGLPLGVLPEASFAEHRLDCAPSDQILLYSDGLIESRNAQGDLFSFDRLYHTLDDHAPNDAQLVIRALRAAWRDFSGGNLDDDMTILVVQIDDI